MHLSGAIKVVSKWEFTQTKESRGENKWKGKFGGWDHPLPLPSAPLQKSGPSFILYMVGFYVRLPLRKGSLMKINESDNYSFLGLT